ncbi:MAG: AEC family transporter [Eubacteriales bacterium]|nr:AEC family transporter [Eubacteriales bacterium]
MSMHLVLQQILVIFCYVAVGIGAGRLGIIDPDQRKYLTKLCSSLILPFTILSAASMEVDAEGFRSLGLAMGIMFLVMGGTMAVSLLLFRAAHAEDGFRTAMTSLITFPNCTFLGLPLCKALFGEIAVLYNCAALIVFNVLFFTVQLPLFTGGKINLKAILTVPTLTTVALLVMLALGLHWPVPVQTVVSSIGSMITPLSLIIIGVMLSENDLLAIFREKAVYLVMALRNFLLPALAMLVLMAVPMNPQDKLCVLVYLACPCATLTTIYSIQTDIQPELCAHSVLFSTISFAISLPVVIAAGQLLFGVLY